MINHWNTPQKKDMDHPSLETFKETRYVSARFGFSRCRLRAGQTQIIRRYIDITQGIEL